MNNILEIKPNTIIGDNFVCELILSSWSGFQSRQGFYTSKDIEDTSNGLTKVYIEGKEIDQNKIVTLEQINALKYLLENSDKVKDIILNRLLSEMPELKEIYEDLIPDIKKIEDFKDYVGLSNVYLMTSDKDGYAYTGFELGCDWDEEHGIGIMMHKDRVIDIGDADIAFASWITFEDNGTIEDETKKWEEANSKLQMERQVNEVKKPWWKFW